MAKPSITLAARTSLRRLVPPLGQIDGRIHTIMSDESQLRDHPLPAVAASLLALLPLLFAAATILAAHFLIHYLKSKPVADRKPHNRHPIALAGGGFLAGWLVG